MKTRRSQAGFTLLEVLIVVGIMAVLAMTIIPGILKGQVETRAAEGMKENLFAFFDASRNFRFECGRFENDLDELKSPPAVPCSGNPTQIPYLPSTFALSNPFGGAITFTSTSNLLTVTVPVNPEFMPARGLFSVLPGYATTVSGFTAAVVRPGLEMALDEFVKKEGDTMTGDLVMNNGAVVRADDFWNNTINNWESNADLRFAGMIASGAVIAKPTCKAPATPKIYGAVASDYRRSYMRNAGGGLLDTRVGSTMTAVDGGTSWTVTITGWGWGGLSDPATGFVMTACI